MINLLNNAITFFPQHTPIVITLAKGINNFTIRIHDYGEGIDAKDVPYIFHVFYKGDGK